MAKPKHTASIYSKNRVQVPRLVLSKRQGGIGPWPRPLLHLLLAKLYSHNRCPLSPFSGYVWPGTLLQTKRCCLCFPHALTISQQCRSTTSKEQRTVLHCCPELLLKEKRRKNMVNQTANKKLPDGNFCRTCTGKKIIYTPKHWFQLLKKR